MELLLSCQGQGLCVCAGTTEGGTLRGIGFDSE